MCADHISNLFGKSCAVYHLFACYNEAFEFIMAMFVFVVMMVIVIVVVVMVDLMPCSKVTFRTDALAQNDIDGQGTHGRLHHLHTCTRVVFEFASQGGCLFCGKKICLVDHDHIRTGDLVFEQFRKWRLMVQVFVLRALGVYGGDVMRELSIMHCASIDDRHDPIHSDFGRDARPVEGADQRLGQCQTRGFDDDVIWFLIAGKQSLHRGDKVICDRAADAPVG